MQVKSFITLMHRQVCRHGTTSKGVDVWLDYFTRQWGLRYKVSRFTHVCKCTSCGQPFATVAESQTLML